MARHTNDVELGFRCPACGGSDIEVFYSCPLQYKCSCGVKLIDKNAGPAIQVISEEVGRRKRPGLYGDPVCSCCKHAPHDGACEFCAEDEKLHVYAFEAA